VRPCPAVYSTRWFEEKGEPKKDRMRELWGEPYKVLMLAAKITVQ
jgi:hypothetical protein